MKRVLHSLLMVAALASISSCKKDPISVTNATVVGKGLDCGDTYLLKMDSPIPGLVTIDNSYYALNLPAGFKVKGLRVNAVVRKATDGEGIACTMMGYSYPQVWVTNIKK